MLKRSLNWSLLVGLLLFVLSFSLFFMDVFEEKDLARATVPSGLAGNYLAGDRAYLLEEIDIDVSPDQRKTYIAWEKDDGADTDIFVERRQYNIDNDFTCLNEERISTDSAGQRRDPAVAVNEDEEFVVVWADNSASMTGYDIVFNLYNSSCAAVATETRVNTVLSGDQTNPQVSMDNDGNFIVVWQGPCDSDADGDSDDSTGICARGFNSSGVALDATEYLVNSYTTGNQQNPDVALDSASTGEFIVVWDGEGTGDAQGIYAQGYSAYGTPTTGGDQAVNVTTDGNQQNPRIAVNEAGETLRYAVAWDGNGSGDSTGIYARRATGCLAASCPFANTELSVNTSTSSTQDKPVIEMNYRGDFFVAWRDASTADNKVMGQMFTFAGETIGSEKTVSNNGFISATEIGAPTIGMAGDGYFVVAFDACLDADCGDAGITESKWVAQGYGGFIYQTGDNLGPANFATYSLNGVVDGDIAVDPTTGNFAVVWSGDGDDGNGRTDSDGIWLTLYDKDGDTINSIENIHVNTLSAGAQNRPKVSFFEDNSTFVVCYDGAGDIDGDSTADDTDGIFYRRYSATGVPLDTNEVQVNSNVSATHQECDVDAGSSGAFMLTWKDTSTDSGIIRLSAEGTGGDSTPITLSADAADGAQNRPAVSMNSNNNYVVSWDGYGDSDSTGIYMVKGTHSGGLDGSELLVNSSSTAGTQSDSDINLDGNGLIVVVWAGQGTGDSSGVYAISYNLNATGVAPSTSNSTPTLINKLTSGNQNTPALAGDGNENYVMTFLSDDAALPNSPLARWFEAGDNNTFTIKSPEFYLDEYHFSVISANAAGPAFSPVALYDEGHLMAIVRAKDNFPDGYNWYGTERKLITGDNPALTSTLQQEVLSGGRTLVLPSTITFAAVNANAQSAVTNTLALEDNGDATKYIEVQDLFADGNSYSITFSIGTSFTFTGTASTCTDNNKCIADSNLEIRNYDQDGDRITTVFGDSGDFSLDASTDSFATLDSQRTLATGTGDSVGRWRLYPELRLTIPANVPPGSHSAVLTISLN